MGVSAHKRQRIGNVRLVIRLSRRAHEFDDDLEEIPNDGDYVKTPCGPLGSKTCVGIVGDRGLGQFDTEDEADAKIRSNMKWHNWYSTVWNESDHGNLSVDTSFRS